MKISDSISVSGTSVRSRIDEISQRLGVIKRSESSLAAERISLLTELKTLRFVNAEATLTGDGHLSRREARETMIHSTVVDALPIFGEALAGGTISVAHLESMSRALKIMGDNKDLLLDQAHSLIHAATHMPADDFDSHAKKAAQSLLGDDGASNLERQRRATHLKMWNDLDGMVHLRGQFDPERGAVLQSLINHRVEAMFHSGDKDIKLEVAPGIDANHHRNALALLQLVNGSTSALVTDDQKPLHAELVVHIDLTSLQTGLHDSTVCRTSYGADLPIETARRLACDAEIIPAVLDGRSVPLDVGRAKRLATAGQRRALEAMYQTCAIDGCDRPFHHCSIHHIKYWENGGSTDLSNMLPLCSRHHHAAHEGGWQLHLEPETRILTVTGSETTVP